MVVINELTRPNIQEEPYQKDGITAMNSAQKMTDKCSWHCHNNTAYCKTNHVKLMSKHFKYTDSIYFGIINTLKSTGNYGLANIIILMLVVPLAIIYFGLRSLQMQKEISKLKNKEWK